MILGIGHDLVSIARIESAVATFGEKFLRRIFTPEEQALAKRRNPAAPTLAKRFAAKEACAKALGCGLWRGVSFTDIGVVNDATGQPALRLSGAAQQRLEALTPKGKTAKLFLTLCDEQDLASAHVLISTE